MNCQKCNCEYTYEVMGVWNCPECGNEWTMESLEPVETVHVDSNGNVLKDGDSVTIIKDLKIKGSSSVIKQGTKIKNIKLRDSDDDHNISCKIDGVGAVDITSKFVKVL